MKETLEENEKKIVLVPKTQILIRIVFLSSVVLTLFTYIVFSTQHRKCQDLTISIKNISFCSLVADDDIERAKGLSGVKNIADHESILFIFGTESLHGIWMKEMLVPIDIVWVSAEKNVLHIENNVSPSSYPKIYYPKEKSKYVIEFRAGTTHRIGLKLGDKISW